jgi:hypothetical protein
MGGGAIKENDGGGELNSDILSTLLSVTLYPQYNNNNKK